MVKIKKNKTFWVLVKEGNFIIWLFPLFFAIMVLLGLVLIEFAKIIYLGVS